MQRIKIKGLVKELKMLSFYLLSLIGWIIFFITYLWAYFVGSYRVNINLFGEANIELFLVVGVMLFCFYGLYLHVKNLMGGTDESKATV